MEATPLWRTHGESSPLRKETSRVCAQKALASEIYWGVIIMEEGIAKGGKRMSSFVLGFQDIDKTKLMVVGGKARTWGNCPELMG